MLKGKKENFDFRDLTRGLVIIVNNSNFPVLRNVFESRPHDNAILACGYIDHDAGITFEVLCLGEYGPNDEIDLCRGNCEVSYKLRYDSVDGVVVLLSNRIMPAFQNKIDRVRGSYSVNDDIMKSRDNMNLDTFRHPQYPDDVLLLFLKQGERPERIWCRIESEIDGHPGARLLNEPDGDYGIHLGDSTKFEWVNYYGKMLGLAILPGMESLLVE